MASYNELNALIDAYINRNGVQAITGQILNGVLKAMVEQLGRGYTIMGAAIPTTDPGTPDGPECYFASETGTYTDFNGLQIVPGELALLCYTPSDGWTKETIYEGFQTVQASIDGNVGTPSVDVSYADGVLSFDFRNMKGNTGDAAGFGTIGADITGGVGTPGVTVESSGPATAKNLQFHFTNLKGETGVTSVVATVDNTTGTPACTVSLEGQQLTLAFSGLKGAQGDTGSSVDYPFTIVNNLTTDDATQALSAAQGVVLDGKVTQLEAKVDEIMPAFEVSPNLLDVSAMTADSRMNAQTGAIISDTDCDLSDYIEVEEGVAYISQGNIGQGPSGIVASRWYFFDSLKTYIAWSLVTAATATVPTGARYTRVAIQKKDGVTTIVDKMIARGSTVIAYVPFYKRIATEWLPPVESQYDLQSEGALQNKVISDTILNGVGYGQQSIPNSAIKQTTAGKNKFNPNDPDFIVGRLITATATTANATGASTGFIPVKPGDTYVGYLATANEYAQHPNKAANHRFRVNAYDANKTPISGAYSSSATGITVPAGAAYIRFGFIDYTLTYNHMVVLDNSTNPPSSIDYAPFEFVLDVKNINLSEQNNDAGFIELVKGKIAIPDIKAFVGYPINIYHWNIVDYMMNGYFFRCISKGELTRKKWSYTPQGAETFNLNLIYLDPSKRELNNETIPVSVVATSQKASLTVLVIGDSTVNQATSLPGGGETGKMLALASADNYPLTLLGTRGTGANQHEGRGGWTAKMMCIQASAGTTPNAFWNPNTSKFDFSYYMAQQGYSGVDCVFFQFGINDMTSYNESRIINDVQAESAIAEMFTYMDEMIASVHDYDSSIKIVINTTIPCTDDQDVWLVGNQPCWRHKRNTWMLNVASLTHYASMANVFVSWYAACFNNVNLTDSVHPTQAGYDQLGEQMYSFMRAIN